MSLLINQPYPSFDVFLHDYSPLILSSMNQLHVHYDFDEFYQIGRIALWEVWQKHDPEAGSIGAYAKTVVISRMIDEIRRRSKHTELTEKLINRNATLAQYNVRFLEKEEFEQSLVALTAKERCWAIQAIWYGRSTKEIAKREGATVEQVKKWRQRARKKLLKCYNTC
ncbi:sigma-70 family RNA polymerase sigma factor [Bacillaceae bacterium SIJ1]|uniref:sigma-70 family RNA polymerase sigma factor n=1 Tax=Litoribacterium kuwaitense TaxID=1398745 RepID=UPI0013EB4181|nr:sigma-70 family RNA polymerase sigma factor [Litoribacterium kuwaitense]NGP44797.1 sigma-70 family RNA polymerase sigma factor [Litoribacterium kuwaitense]